MDFGDWMESALYDKEKGYYSTHLETIPDYVTALNFGPYLGWAVGRELARLWQMLPANIAPKIFTLVDVGCGAEAGLVRAVLEIFQKEFPDVFVKTQAILVDRSLARLCHAAQALERLFPGKIFSCPDITQIPSCWGAIISNELFDALPVELIRRGDHDCVERACVRSNQLCAVELSWQETQDPVLISYALDLPVGVPYALNLEALKILKTFAAKLEHGFVLTIDYGELRPRIFSRNPIKAFKQRTVKAPDLDLAGSEDITSPVDFSLLADRAAGFGLEALSCENLMNFLLRNGIGDFYSEPRDSLAVQNNLRLKTLIHPVGFGEDFKVLLQGK